jgi:histidine phosphotransferase ChpT
MTKPIDLAGLIGSRICHDIISPLGAVGNGVELMVLSGQNETPEFELVRESIESANLRIKFFRVAFGLANAGQTVSRSEIVMLAKAATTGGRLRVDWNIEGGLPRPELKRILLGILCLEHLLSGGGTVFVAPAGPGRWKLTGEGPKIKDAPHLPVVLSSDAHDDALAAGEVQFTLLRMESEVAGLQAELQASAGGLTLTV